jgi:serine/threonine protein kinase
MVRVYYNDKSIGKGTFGEVHRAIRARDGKYFAAKTFIPPANKRKLDEVDPAWLTGIRREFAIMRDNPHVSVPWLCLF